MLSLAVNVSVFDMLLFFFFNDTATTEISPLSLHDALPIWGCPPMRCRTSYGEWISLPSIMGSGCWRVGTTSSPTGRRHPSSGTDRKSTRLNSSHANISYAVFCLKKKKTSSQHSPLVMQQYA